MTKVTEYTVVRCNGAYTMMNGFHAQKGLDCVRNSIICATVENTKSYIKSAYLQEHAAKQLPPQLPVELPFQLPSGRVWLSLQLPSV